MNKKRITQKFPWLLPIRKIQRKFFFYMRMKFDGNHYSNKKSDFLFSYLIFETSCPIYNEKTGFDMLYQKNKEYNLKLAADTVNGIMIQPHETFSFWRLVRYADKYASYREGWLDLKVRNDTESIFQINISFDGKNIIGRILTNEDIGKSYVVTNGAPVYYKDNQKTYEKVDVIQNIILPISGELVSSNLLYVNLCEIGYKLSEDINRNK